jgi:hypothetical protein
MSSATLWVCKPPRCLTFSATAVGCIQVGSIVALVASGVAPHVRQRRIPRWLPCQPEIVVDNQNADRHLSLAAVAQRPDELRCGCPADDGIASPRSRERGFASPQKSGDALQHRQV